MGQEVTIQIVFARGFAGSTDELGIHLIISSTRLARHGSETTVGQLRAIAYVKGQASSSSQR